MANEMTSDTELKPLSAEPYVAGAQIKLGELKKGLKTELTPYPQVPSLTEIKTRLGDQTKPIKDFADYSSRVAKVEAELGNVVAAETALKERQGALETQKELEDRIVKAASKSYAADYADRLRSAHEQIIAENPYKSLNFTQENVTSLATLFSLLGVVAIGGGAGTRFSAMNAMNAMTGMLAGWQKGRADLWKKEQVEFEKNMAATKAKLDSYAKKADLAWKTLPYDVEKAEAIMAELVAETGSQIVKQKALIQGIPDTAKYLQDLKKGFDTQYDNLMKERREKREEARDAETRKHHRAVEAHQTAVENKKDYQYFVTDNNEVVYINKKDPSDKGIVSQFPGEVRTLGKPKPTDKIPKKGETVARFVGGIIGRPVDSLAAEKMVAGVDFIDKLGNLKNKSVELGNVAGLSVSIADKVNSLLTANVPADPATGQKIITQESMDKAWEAAKDSKEYKALSDKSKVMAKAELDTIMSYLQAKYGNRAPVAEFRAAQQVISRRSASATAFQRVMNEEIASARNRIVGAGFTKEDIDKVSQQFEIEKKKFEEPSETSNLSSEEQQELERLRAKHGRK